MSFQQRASAAHSRALSPTRTSEVTIPAPHLPYKVVLRPEFRDLSPLPDANYFHVTDWIYSQEAESVLREHHNPLKPFIQHGNEGKQSKREDVSGVKPAYLVDMEETEPCHRELLREKICMDLNSFYYYKKRHLFRPRNLQNRAKLPKLARSSVKNSPKADITTPRQAFKGSQMGKTPRSTTPKHKQSLSLSTAPDSLSTAPDSHFFKSLLGKCEEMPTSNPLFVQTKKEIRLQQRLSQRLKWTKETLEQVRDCEVDILIPYYKLQKEALEDSEQDTLRIVDDYRHSSMDRSDIKPRKKHK